MPHKHKRKREDDDVSQFDLAPNIRAKPLAAYNKASIFSSDNDSKSHKRRKADAANKKPAQDDTPKAFARLMAWQATGKKPAGLDNGNTTKPAKKQQHKISHSKDPQQAETARTRAITDKPNVQTTSTPITTIPSASTLAPAIPKILPGESLSSFALRVDQSLPLTNISRSNNSNLPADLRAKLAKTQRTTKHNKRLQRMQADWRAEDARIRQKEADAAEDMQERNEEEDLLWAGVRSAERSKKGKKNRKKITATVRNNNGTGDDERWKNDDDDPWKDLEKRRREETKQKNLQDVVTAPPVLKKVKNIFKTLAADFDAVNDRREADEHLAVNVDNAPAASGNLTRRQDLNAGRRAGIQEYRKPRGGKRGVDGRIGLSGRLRPESL